MFIEVLAKFFVPFHMLTDICFIMQRKTYATETMHVLRCGYSPSSRVNKTYLSGCSSEPSLTLKSFFYFLIWRLQLPNQKIKKAFQRHRRLGLPRLPGWHEVDMYNCTSVSYHCGVNKCYLHSCQVNFPLSMRLPGEQVGIQALIYLTAR